MLVCLHVIDRPKEPAAVVYYLIHGKHTEGKEFKSEQTAKLFSTCVDCFLSVCCCNRHWADSSAFKIPNINLSSRVEKFCIARTMRIIGVLANIQNLITASWGQLLYLDFLCVLGLNAWRIPSLKVWYECSGFEWKLYDVILILLYSISGIILCIF